MYMRRLFFGIFASLLALPSFAVITKTAEIGPFSSIRDEEMISPKSVLFHPILPKFYVNALEAGKTLVYEVRTLKKLKTISHSGVRPDAASPNVFGKPVEGWFTHHGKYLWITYYRWSDDPFALRGSGFAQIDTTTDEIVKVYPTGNIPKFITSNKNDTQMAVTLWGENRVEIYVLSSTGMATLQSSITVGPKVVAALGSDRDQTCGMCLRGTAYLPGTPYLVVAKMGGGGLAVLDVNKLKVAKMVQGVPLTPRHLEAYDNYLYITANVSGSVSRISIPNLVANVEKNESLKVLSAHIGSGARTLKIDKNKVYVALSNSKQVARMNLDFTDVEYSNAAPYPVGLDVKDGLLLVTSQGKKGVGGHKVGVYSVTDR
jgi:DNA-binding beta-propeller fold protein YncE